MKVKKFKTIQSKMFTHYTIIVGVTIFILLIIFYYYSSVILTNTAKESLVQISNAITAGLNAEIGKANDLQKRILFSGDFKNLIFSDSNLFSEGRIELQRTFSTYTRLVCGPDDFRNYQINILNLNGNYAGVGYNSFVKKLEESQIYDMKHIPEIIKLDGKKVITSPYNTLWANRNTVVVSVFRSFSERNLLIPQAILETQIDYELINAVIEQNLSVLLSDNNGKKIIVYNDKNQLIYPFPSSLDDERLLNSYIDLANMENTASFLIQAQEPEIGKKEIIAGSYSDFLDWKVLVVQPEDILLRSVNDMRNLVSVLGFIIICVAILLAYSVAKGISAPIQVIHSRITNFKLGEPQKDLRPQVISSVLEIEDLNRVFNDMCFKLNESLDTIVSIRAYDMQAKMLAMQSQMNPHFLYNTLSIIKIMGKEGNSESVVKMCENLSRMMRYISDAKPAPVLLENEIAHTLRYIDFINIRYQNKIDFRIDIPEEMYKIQVPRVILQPLVENSIKFVTEAYPPWVVRVEGRIENDIWTVSVADNGIGFTVEKKRELEDRFVEYNPEQELPATQIDGMGLINIFARLKLVYREKAVFKLEQSGEGETIVIIGGAL